jgi:hypothetical protein
MSIDIMRQGGLEALLSEALPSVASSAAIFANAPADTQLIVLTVRTAGITLRFDGSAATAGANGHDYAVTTDAPKELMLNKTAAVLVRAIQNGGTATGWITYFGITSEGI